MWKETYFPKRPSGAPYHTLSKLYDVPVGFEPPPPILRLNIAYLAVAEGWLLLDIGLFDHMRISGTEPNQWSLAKQSSFKSWKEISQVPKTNWIKRGGVINPQNYNYNKFQHGKF